MGGVGTILSAFYKEGGVNVLTLYFGMFQLLCSVVLTFGYMMGVLGGPIGILIYLTLAVLHVTNVNFYSLMCWRASREAHYK
jgi:hypothetical protein